MSKTLGELYDSILVQIEKTQESQSYQTESGAQLNRGTLFRLYEERDRLLEKIEIFGRNYIEGQNIAPTGDISLVSFA